MTYPASLVNSNGELFQEPVVLIDPKKNPKGITEEKKEVLKRLNLKKLPEDYVINYALKSIIDKYKEPTKNVLIEDLSCPISHDTLLQPVIALDGTTYEELFLKKHFNNSNISPMTNKVLKNKMYVPNQNLEQYIENTFVKENLHLKNEYDKEKNNVKKENLINNISINVYILVSCFFLGSYALLIAGISEHSYYENFQIGIQSNCLSCKEATPKIESFQRPMFPWVLTIIMTALIGRISIRNHFTRPGYFVAMNSFDLSNSFISEILFSIFGIFLAIYLSNDIIGKKNADFCFAKYPDSICNDPVEQYTCSGTTFLSSEITIILMNFITMLTFMLHMYGRPITLLVTRCVDNFFWPKPKFENTDIRRTITKP